MGCIRSLQDVHHPPTGNHTALAGSRAHQDGICHLPAADIGCTLKRCLGPVFLRHVPQVLQVVRRPGGAGFLHDGGQVLFQQVLVGLYPQFFVGWLIRQGDFAGAAHSDCLEMFGSHHGTHPGASSCPSMVRNDTGIRHQVFPGAPNAGNLCLCLTGFRLDQGLCFVGVSFSPQVTGRADFHCIIEDPEIHGFCSPPGDPEDVIPGIAQFGTHKTADVRFPPQPGMGRAGAQVGPPRGWSPRAGQRTGHPYQRAGWIQRIWGGIEGIPEQACSQSAAADVIPGIFCRDGSFFNCSSG